MQLPKRKNGCVRNRLTLYSKRPCFFTQNLLKRTIQLFLAFLGCLQLCGGPLGFMQGVAWVGMTISYSANDGIVEGVKKTFDGDHPCRLCCALEEARKQQTDQQPLKPASAPDFKFGKMLTDISLSEPVKLPPAIRNEVMQGAVKEMGWPSGIGPVEPSVPPPRPLSAFLV